MPAVSTRPAGAVERKRCDLAISSKAGAIASSPRVSIWT